MQTRTILWIVAVAVLYSASFFLGRLSVSHRIITYSVNGCSTSVNVAWPTYGLPLAEDTSLLKVLRAGGATNAISKLDVMMEVSLYDAMCRRPLLHGHDRETLDEVLAMVARYREQHPWQIDSSTNGFADPEHSKQYEHWIEEQKLVDAFLRTFVVTNEQPNPFAGAGAGRTPEIIEMIQVGASRRSGSARLVGR